MNAARAATAGLIGTAAMTALLLLSAAEVNALGADTPGLPAEAERA